MVWEGEGAGCAGDADQEGVRGTKRAGGWSRNRAPTKRARGPATAACTALMVEEPGSESDSDDGSFVDCSSSESDDSDLAADEAGETEDATREVSCAQCHRSLPPPPLPVLTA